MKNILSIALFSFSVILFNSCTKVEGQGGGSTIKGVINEQKYSVVGTLVSQYPAAEKDVYIIYGAGNTFYNDKTKTSYDGSFEFNYLQKGDYTIFVYEDNNTDPSGTSVVMVTTTIKDKKSTIDLGTIDTKKL